MRPGGRGEAGFSLIEALVALTVAAIALVAIFALQDQLSMGERRNAEALRLVALQRNALALTTDLNPMAEPQGAVRLAGGQTVRWRATPLTAPRTQVGLPSGEGDYVVGLYRLDVDIVDANGRRLGSLAFDRVGWRPVTSGR